jgi:hypothetical protein
MRILVCVQPIYVVLNWFMQYIIDLDVLSAAYGATQRLVETKSLNEIIERQTLPPTLLTGDADLAR